MVEGEVENNSFGDRGNCKCPPYTIQTEAGLSEDHGKWDSGTGEDNADDTAKLCHTKTGKCANIVFGLPETCGLEEIANPV